MLTNPSIPPIQHPDDTIRWYAMRVTYRRELAVRDYLNEKGVETFIPMRHALKIKRGVPKRQLIPAINSLLFVHAPQSTIQNIKAGIPHLQYITDKNHRKITVPENQMHHFIAACSSYDESLNFFDPSEVNLTKGTPVRIIGGDFEGMEGVFIKIKGKRDRRVVVAIQGVIAVAIATIHPDLIQLISSSEER